MNQRKYELIEKIVSLSDADDDILSKMESAYDFAYSYRTFYIASIKLDTIKNNGEIVLKTGWTRNTVESRFSDKRNGYIGIDKIYKEYIVTPEMSERLNDFSNEKFTNKDLDIEYNYMGKTETIDSKYKPIDIIKACDKFINENKNKYTGRGKIN